jgi:3-deoxy-D-manno-octulosonic-acid transferase
MALPLIQKVRAELPDVQIAYTFFSPSAERFARTLDVDIAEYLPFDTAAAAERLLDALAPNALIFSKLDVWPILVEHAHARGVKLGLTSAAMSSASLRTRGIGAALTRDAYGMLDRVGAASERDAKALVKAGVHPNRIQVTGDTRYDQAWTRAHVTLPNQEVVDDLHTHERFTLVAGSTWPADEAVLFPAWQDFARSGAGVTPRLIIAPHEIRDTQLRQIETWAKRASLSCKRIAEPGVEYADVVLVDRIGILADLYRIATVAYVGGGFHSHGLHSVVEPAVFHVPILVGPQSSSSRDAMIMRDDGGLLVVNDAKEMATSLTSLATSDALRSRMQHALSTTVSRELGATQRSFEIVRELLGVV